MLWPWQLFSKRFVGHANLLLSRQWHFKHALMPALIEHALEREADAFVFSGDLTTTSLPTEFADARKMLAPIVDEHRAFIVPGNHDEYTFGASNSGLLAKSFPEQAAVKYPRFELLGDNWLLLAVNSAWPRMLSSRGKIGHEQLNRIAHYLATVEPGQGVVILCHYPVYMPGAVNPKWQHRLEDADALQKMVEQCPGRVVFLHGHIHKPWCYRPTEPAAKHVVDVNAGAPCYCTSAYPYGHGYWTVDLPRDVRAGVKAVHHYRGGTGAWASSSTNEPV